MRIRRCATVLAAACGFCTISAAAAPADSPQHDMRSRSQVDIKQGYPLVARNPDPALGADKDERKYFHEPGGDDILGHYDLRFFKGVVTHEERSDTLRHMIRAYLTFFREKGLETWIAHGTLLGWWWNGKLLPWDWDIDTQVSAETLDYLGKNFNHTRVPYTHGSVSREYLLDVNPWIWERDRGDGMNVIDARFIDVRNGLYIDITGLSETQPQMAPGIWSCKNYHHYRTKDLYPMRESMFEGVPARIPYAYDRILVEEYQKKALVLTEYEGHYWDENLKEWIQKSEKTPHEPEPLNNYRKRSA